MTEDKLDRLALRQEALIASIHDLVDVVETMRDMQALPFLAVRGQCVATLRSSRLMSRTSGHKNKR